MRRWALWVLLLKNLQDKTQQLIPEVDLLLVALAVHLDQGPPVAGVDLVARVHTQVYLHGDFVLCKNTAGLIIDI